MNLTRSCDWSNWRAPTFCTMLAWVTHEILSVGLTHASDPTMVESPLTNLMSNYIYNHIINRPGVARAVLQTPSWLTESVSDPLWKYLQKSFTPKLEEIASWNFERRFTSRHLSCVTCHMSHITCHVSHVTLFFYFFLDRGLKLIGGGSVNNGAYPV